MENNKTESAEQKKKKKKNRGIRYIWIYAVLTILPFFVIYFVSLDDSSSFLSSMTRMGNALFATIMCISMFSIAECAAIRLFTCMVRKDRGVMIMNLVTWIIMGVSQLIAIPAIAFVYYQALDHNTTESHGFLGLFNGVNDSFVYVLFGCLFYFILIYVLFLLLYLKKTKPVRMAVKEEVNSSRAEKKRVQMEEEEKKRIEKEELEKKKAEERERLRLENLAKEEEERKRLEEEKRVLEEKKKEEDALLATKAKEDEIKKEEERRVLEEKKKEEAAHMETDVPVEEKKEEEDKSSNGESEEEEKKNEEEGERNMEEELRNCSTKTIAVIGNKIAQEHPSNISPLYKKILAEKIKEDLFSKKWNINYGLDKETEKNVSDGMDSFFMEGHIVDGLKKVEDYLIGFFDNYRQHVSNPEWIREKKANIESYQKNLSGYASEFSDEGNEPWMALAINMINLINSATLFYNAQRIAKDDLLSQLSVIAASCQAIEQLSVFSSYKNQKKTMMYRIMEIHSYFMDLYSDLSKKRKANLFAGKTEEEFQKEFLQVRDDNFYYLNLLYMAYNQIECNYFKKVSRDALKIIQEQKILPQKLLNSNAVLKIISYFQDMRVSDMKEAINLFFNETREEEKYNQIVNEMNQKVTSLTNELNKTKKELDSRTEQMEEAYESLRKAHNNLIHEHNELVDDHNRLSDNQREIIQTAREIKDELDRNY